MNEQQRAAMQMALEALERLVGWMDSRDMVVAGAEREAITALREALPQPQDNLNCKSVQKRLATSWGYVKEQPQCNPHPDAPHGFDRNASHSADRYVCECESWAQPQGEWVDLTEVEVDLVIDETYGESPELYVTQVRHDFSKALLAKFKEKNTPPSVEAAIEATKEKAAKLCEETEYCSLTSEERPLYWFECAAAIRSMK